MDLVGAQLRSCKKVRQIALLLRCEKIIRRTREWEDGKIVLEKKWEEIAPRSNWKLQLKKTPACHWILKKSGYKKRHKFLDKKSEKNMIQDGRVTLKLLTPPPPRTKTKDLFINSRFNCFKIFTASAQSFLRPFQPTLDDRKKVNFSEEPQRRPYTIINFPSNQHCHSLRVFSQFWEQGRIAGG